MINLIIWWNPAPAPAGFALQIRQNPAPAGFPKSRSGTALVMVNHCSVRLLFQQLSQLHFHVPALTRREIADELTSYMTDGKY